MVLIRTHVRRGHHAETTFFWQKREATIALAVVDIYVLDFVINIGAHT